MPEQSSTIAPATRYLPLAPELAMRHQALAEFNCAFQMPRMPYSDNDLNRLIVHTGIIKRFDVLAISSAQVSRVTFSSDLELQVVLWRLRNSAKAS